MGHLKPFRHILTIRNGSGVQISSSLIPVMSKIIKFERALMDFDRKYDDQHDHKHGYNLNLVLVLVLTFVVVILGFVCKFLRKWWY